MFGHNFRHNDLVGKGFGNLVQPSLRGTYTRLLCDDIWQQMVIALCHLTRFEIKIFNHFLIDIPDAAQLHMLAHL
jgi:hypothetical protein